MKLQIGIDGKTYEVDVEIAEDDTAPRPHYIPAQATPTALVAAVPVAAPSATTETVADESKVCRSPIAGMVTRVNVQVGQQIQPNDLLLVLEAMKMETSVTSPVAGKVKRVTVESGEGVQLNQVLVEFES